MSKILRRLYFCRVFGFAKQSSRPRVSDSLR